MTTRTRRISALARISAVAAVVSAFAFFERLRIHRHTEYTRPLTSEVDREEALEAMNYDVESKEFLKGMTKEQLKARFGYIRALNEVSPYYQACLISPGRFSVPSVNDVTNAVDSESAFFLRNSPWMAVMKDGRVADVVMCKGY